MSDTRCTSVFRIAGDHENFCAAVRLVSHKTCQLRGMVRHLRHPAHHSISVCEECGRHMSVHGRNPVKFIIVYGIDHDKWRLVCAPIRVNVDGNRDGRLDVWVQQYQAESEDAAPTGTDVRRAQSKPIVEAVKTWLETKSVEVYAMM